MQETLRQYYLTAMGINHWWLRDIQHNDQTEHSVIYQVQVGAVRLCTATLINPLEQQLWTNILAAITDKPKAAHHCRCLLQFGECEISADFSGEIITLPTIAELLATPQLKRKVWQQLQSLTDLFAVTD